MKGLKLDVYQFYLLNYEDWLGLFDREKSETMDGLVDTAKENFNPYHFDYKQTKELFKVYEHLIISPNDTISGAIGKNYYQILYKEGIYNFALTYFNKDLTL